MNDKNDMELDAITALAERYHSILGGIDQWYEVNFAPLVRETKTEAELIALWGNIHRACAGPGGEIRELPGLLHMEKVFSFDALHQRIKANDSDSSTL